MDDKKIYDEEIEKTILYYLIFEQEQLNLKEEDFVLKKHKQIFNAIQNLKDKREEINLLSIKQEINKDNKEILEYISNLANYSYGTSVDYAYKQLKRISKKRKLLEMADDIKRDVEKENETEIYIEKLIKELSDINTETEKEKTFLDMIVETSDLMLTKKNKGANFDYKYYTGIFDLDKVTNGLHPEEFTVIGARPGMGKSTFALQIAENIAEKGVTVGIISLEMSEVQLIEKIISRKANIDSKKIEMGAFDDTEEEKIYMAISQISDLPIFINTRARTIQDIEMYARKLKNRNNLGLLVVDYIQLIECNVKNGSREQEIAAITRTLKLLSGELKIPIIGLCQLNRNAAKMKPTLSDLRESGAIEQDANNVILLYREDDESEGAPVEDIVIDLQKQRMGNLTKATVRFDKKVSSFKNLVRR